ncbi:hypothetical protein GCM10010435_50450 [Winogradskya consettensis]|uniref:TetR family transcriptional regulator n=2 Tax=Winogradskya consettensis TaxID=113560 RepID=A0A919VY91_9ACTN|nr:hypothetical protein Aco04nite_69350 [Actinoplanes consettensis]
MFAAKLGEGSDAVHQASMRLFGILQTLPGESTLLFTATLQGIAAMVSSRRITADQGDALVGAAITRLVPDPA